MKEEEKSNKICVVCGSRLPNLVPQQMIDIGSGMKINNEQIIYFCIKKHTEEEIMNAIQGVPKFKKASELKEGLI